MNNQNINSIGPVGLDASASEKAVTDHASSDCSRPAWIEIDLAALRHNIAVIRSKIGPVARLMAVVKANAYGHGAVRISKVASEEGVDYLGVALLEEADEIHNAGIKTPIVILYPENVPRAIEAIRKGYIITVSETAMPERLSVIMGTRDIPIRYFLKLNTGMNRYGIRIKNNSELFDSIPTGYGFEFLGFMTNLAGSNGADTPLSLKQEKTFCELMKCAEERFGDSIYLSYESSGSLSKKNGARGTLLRIGHLMYGSLNAEESEYKPVMSVKSRIAEIKDVIKGEGVGYGFSFIARKNTRIAVIPMGYADGYPWSLSNKGHILVNGQIARIAGRVCMDAFMVDITDLGKCKIGDEVVVMGPMGDRKICAHTLGKLAGSFSYEIMSRWSRRLPRIYK